MSDALERCVVCGDWLYTADGRIYGPPQIYRLSSRNQDEVSCCSKECARVLVIYNALQDASEASRGPI